MSDQTTASSSATANPGVVIQLAIHGAVRRDMQRLVDALGAGAVSTEAVRAYATESLDHLHHHHTFEDADVWPEMGRRLGGSYTAMLERNASEHDDIVAAVAAFTATLDAIGDDPVAAQAAAVRMRDLISVHLAHEEADVIPLIPQAFGQEDFERFQAVSAEADPPPLFLPWLLESAPEPLATAFNAQLPPPVQEQLAAAWMPVWQAKVDAIATPAGAR